MSPAARAPKASALVTTEWLAQNPASATSGCSMAPGIPQLKRDARAEFAQAHIPGSVFFDIDAIADHGTTCRTCCRARGLRREASDDWGSEP